jgi:NAD(P)-dependent dehydrogenase (short-subunit alcohol dehydrogenase family)
MTEAQRTFNVASRRLDGRSVVVTGAATGIGYGIARRAAAEGARVALIDIRGGRGRTAASTIERDFGGDAIFVEADVGDRSAVFSVVDEVMQRFGHLDGIVNGAQAFTPTVPLHEKTDSMFEVSLRVGLWSTLWMMQASFPHLRRQGSGSIVNFASVNGTMGVAYTADYNTAKEAIRGLTRSAAQDWGVFGIRVNCVEPNALTEAWGASAADPDALRARSALLPLRRIGDPEEDIAPAAVFLLSDDSRYVTGTTLHADGGTHIRMSRPPVRATRPDGTGHYTSDGEPDA